MRRLLVLACLLTAATAQQYFYCNSAGRNTIRQRDFFLVTRRANDTGYLPGLTCEFNAESDTAAFLVEIVRWDVRTAVLTISSGSWTLFRGSSVQDYQYFITTTSKSLRVRFDATGDYSYNIGFLLRVQAFTSIGCPLGWSYLYRSCFSINSLKRLNFTDAQKACNRMRSNLLHIPGSHIGSIRSFMRMLPGIGMQESWIGLTDRTSAGQYRPYWLNGNQQSGTMEIKCASGGSYRYPGCYASERCAAMFDSVNDYVVYMNACTAEIPFVCSMPPGGTNVFYPVPNANALTTTTTTRAPSTTRMQVSTTRTIVIDTVSTSTVRWDTALILAAVGLGVGLLIVLGIYCIAKNWRVRGAAARANVHRVSVSHITGGSRPTQQPPVWYPGLQVPKYSDDLPSYEEAIAGGHPNQGYM